MYVWAASLVQQQQVDKGDRQKSHRNVKSERKREQKTKILNADKKTKTKSQIKHDADMPCVAGQL